MKKFIILLDGAKGAGKTTTSEELKKLLSGTAFFSLDDMRRFISGRQLNDKYNNIAFDALVSASKAYLGNDINIVLDCGLRKDRLGILYKLAEETDSVVYLYNLYAPKDILWERVKDRASKKGKVGLGEEWYKERFEHVYKTLQDKDFSKHIEIDTTKVGPEERARDIYEGLV